MKKLVFIFALLVMVFTGCSGKSAKNEDRLSLIHISEPTRP